MGVLYTCDGCDKTATKKFHTYSFNLEQGPDEPECCQWLADLCDSCKRRIDDPKTWPRVKSESESGPPIPSRPPSHIPMG